MLFRSSAHSAGTYQGTVERDTLRKLMREFEGALVKEALNHTAKLSDETPPGQVLSILGQVKDDIVDVADRFQKACSAFLAQTLKTTEARLQDLGGDSDPVSAEVKKIDAALDGLEKTLKSVAPQEVTA